jgi:hypothetical protein
MPAIYVSSGAVVIFLIGLVIIIRRRNPSAPKIISEDEKKKIERRRIRWFRQIERNLQRKPKPKAGLVIDSPFHEESPFAVLKKPVKKEPESRSILEKLRIIRSRKHSPVQEVPVYPIAVADVELKKKEKKD